MSELAVVIKRAGGMGAVAELCGVSREAVRRWVVRGRLPRTEYTGETRYAELLAEACAGAVTREELCPPLAQKVKHGPTQKA